MRAGRGADPSGIEPRGAALGVLVATSRGALLDAALDASSVAPLDRAWVQELTYGVVRLQGRLDHLLDRHLTRGIGSLPADVRMLLRMGAYQGLYMGAVPGYAAVSESVGAVRRARGGKLAGVANAVLRRVLEDGDGPALFPDPKQDLVGHLCTWGSHPRWLVERWLRTAAPERVTAWVEQNNRVPEVCIRPFRGPLTRARALLLETGVATEPARGGLCLVLPAGADVRSALELVDGYVQDPAAARVCEHARPAPEVRVADLCAAPGGKSLALSGAGHPVVAADPSARRLGLLRESAERVGAPIAMVRARAQEPPFRMLPAVLLDVPCTGTGTLRRHPDARWKLDPEKLAALVALQREMLDGAAGAVAPGGLLVYATCSLEPEENEDQVREFLARQRGFRLEGGPDLSESDLWAEEDSGLLRLTPDRTGYDGAFAARLRRVR